MTLPGSSALSVGPSTAKGGTKEVKLLLVSYTTLDERICDRAVLELKEELKEERKPKKCYSITQCVNNCLRKETY